ncbi:uncharacterized protein LOC128745346 [Sabethes cyaneus]|uniref:uncharacterized protein LOC128745346 n=1 Tax=Sabethes cyaneus TaxID=53552 RepID=UPI00237E9D4A|nr:uncharacterized protein LOC128745346 [Sabethes cyaneus]
MRCVNIYYKILAIGFYIVFVRCTEFPECMPVLNFVSHYTKLLDIIPRNIVPISSYCSNDTFTSFYERSVSEYQQALSDHKCHFHLHKLNVIEMLFNQMQEIWTNAHCQDCIDNKNDTQEFFELTNQLSICVNNSIAHKESPCTACATNYSLVQDHYETTNKQRRGKLCFDIEDQMNQTRHDWSAQYNCCADKQRSQKLFISFATIFSSLPLIFYVIMYLITQRKATREELARVPLLDTNSDSCNQIETSTQKENENNKIINQTDQEPTASSSHAFTNKNISYSENEKINNLGHSHVREGHLITLDAETANASINKDKGSKLSPEANDDFNFSKGHASTNNLLGI